MANNISEALNNILQIIESRCTDAGGDIHVDPDHLEAFSAETDYLRVRMDLSPFQAIIFAIIVEMRSERLCSIHRVAKALGMTYLKFMSYAQDLSELRSRGLIRIVDDSEIKVPAEVTEALMKDTPYENQARAGLSSKGIFHRISKLMALTKKGEVLPSDALAEIEALLSVNPETSYAKACDLYLTQNGIPPAERFIFHVMTLLRIKRDMTVFDFYDVEDFISKQYDWSMELEAEFELEDLALLSKGVLAPAGTDGLMTRGNFSFKEEIEKDIFVDIKPRSTSTLKIIDLNDPSGKPLKQMYYNDQEEEQVGRLESLLSPNSLNSVFETMKTKGLRTGFTCLFYGDPGTGKTETVYQMARKTGRKIMETDVAKLRNCYIGETEKNMRALFSDYRTACGENELTPILLFNEADAILGKRMEGAVRSVDRMENSVQNILLQELEDFNGILIATTNLTGNLDPAFERRFLFKIRFNKPELEPRRQIWKSQFPTLSDEEAASLAEEFDFSGGQIENVVRKYTIDSVLSGAESNINQLRQYCLEESVHQSPRNRIGF